jgi:hypothetical protein
VFATRLSIKCGLLKPLTKDVRLDQATPVILSHQFCLPLWAKTPAAPLPPHPGSGPGAAALPPPKIGRRRA